MANKDGVARGRTRFNMLGKDLNRDWDRPADPKLAPENHALETWLEGMIAAGRRPDLAIDLHNDNSGKLHVSRPEGEHEAYYANMERLEALLRAHTWFTEGSTGKGFRNPGTIGEGLLERYGVHACVLELNANWIAGLDDYPSGTHWERFGAGLADVFFAYFEPPEALPMQGLPVTSFNRKPQACAGIHPPPEPTRPSARHQPSARSHDAHACGLRLNDLGAGALRT